MFREGHNQVSRLTYLSMIARYFLQYHHLLDRYSMSVTTQRTDLDSDVSMCDNLRLLKRLVDMNNKFEPSNHAHRPRRFGTIKSVGTKIRNNIEERCLACYVKAN